jgi:hypothetical protein
VKKVLSYILILFIIFTNLFAPFSLGLDQKNKVTFNSNNAEADAGIKVTNTVQNTDTTISGTVRVVWGDTGFLTSNQGVVVTLLDPSILTTNQSATVISSFQVKLSNVPNSSWFPSEKAAALVQEGVFSFTVLPSKAYEIQTVASQDLLSWWSFTVGTAGAVIGGSIGVVAGPVGAVAGATIGAALATPDAAPAGTTISTPLTVTTNTAGNTAIVKAGKQISVNADALLPMCDILKSGTWGGCLGTVLYWGLFKPTSVIFALSGKLLDVTVDYSTKDTSYRSSFVTQGWGVVRDMCNMFFIFVMLYIAISTILNIHGFNTKQTIVNVVIIGLFINFSLFATQVIIDASNIMTRVFYNSNAIAVGPVVGGVVVDQRGTDGEIKLSEAIVSKINPQKLILEATMADKIPTKLDAGQDIEVQSNGVTASTFILICILASIVNIVGFVTFISAGLIFITRVIGLWLAMIMAPLAFFTYILPDQMAGWKMVGWKNWWPETLKMAFLAPVFVFFMYLIIKFLNTGLGIIQNDAASGMDFILGIIIPFIFIMVLLMKAKSIANDMSGEIGQQITSKLSAAGGLALGLATGGAALMGRATIGRLGNSLYNSASLQEAAAKKGVKGMGARLLLRSSEKASKGSFDARNTKAGSAFAKETGMDLSGKSAGIGITANQGGFAKVRADKTAERQKRAKELELSVDSKQRKDLMKMQLEQKRLEDEFSIPIHEIDGKLTAAKQKKAEAVTGSQADIEATKEIQDLNKEKAAYTKGGAKRDANGNITGYNTSNGNISATAVTAAADNLTKAGGEFTNATLAQNDAAQLLNRTLNDMNAAIGGVAQAETELQNAQTAAAAAAARAAAPGASTADAINHTNALSIQAAAQSKLDKINSEVQTKTTIYNNADSAKQITDRKLLTARDNRDLAEQENIVALAAQNRAMAPGGGGLGKSINDLKFGDIPHAELKINKRNNRVKGEFAEYLGSGANQAANLLFSGGQHDFSGDFEAMYKIKMDAKIENSGGGHAAPAASHTATPASHATTTSSHAATPPAPTHH